MAAQLTRFAHQRDPTVPTHESMTAKGWVVDRVVIDENSRKKITIYKDPKRMPSAHIDRRPLAEDLRHPSRKLIQMQGGHSSDPVPVRDLRLSDAFAADGTNDVQAQANMIRAEMADRTVRTQGLFREGPQQQFQGGNKAGFIGYQNVARHMPYMPPTLRDKAERGKSATTVAVPAEAQREREDTRPESKTDGAPRLPVQINLDGTQAGLDGQRYTRNEPKRNTNNVFPDNVRTRTATGPVQIGITGQESDMKPRFPEQVNLIDALGANFDSRSTTLLQGRMRADPQRADAARAPGPTVVTVESEGLSKTIETREKRDVYPAQIDRNPVQNVAGQTGVVASIDTRERRDVVFRPTSAIRDTVVGLSEGITQHTTANRSTRGQEANGQVDLKPRTGLIQPGKLGVFERFGSTRHDNVMGMPLVGGWAPDNGGVGAMSLKQVDDTKTAVNDRVATMRETLMMPRLNGFVF